MNVKKVILLLVLFFFLALTARALYDHSYLGFFVMASANSATELMMWDLTIALTLIALWMIRDARQREGSYLPFVLITALFGAAGPLLYLVTRGQTKARQRLAAGLLLLALVAAAATQWRYADLRNTNVREATPAAAREGRALLQRVAERHGLAAWRRHHTLECVGVDTWGGESPWWPQPRQKFKSLALLGTFSSRVELLDGKADGEVWGLQAWAPYKMTSAGDRPRFLDEPNPAITFYLPTLQYFNELPFRLLSADVALYAGEASYRGRTYHRLFVTWNNPEPQPDFDQYMLWVDRETLLLKMVRYTVRDALRLASPSMKQILKPLAIGTMHFGDYREIDGVVIPFEQTVTLAPPELTQYPLAENFFHRLVLQEARFDTVDASTLVPDPERGAPRDHKPGLRTFSRLVRGNRSRASTGARHLITSRVS